jgi:hypothetical protein
VNFFRFGRMASLCASVDTLYPRSRAGAASGSSAVVVPAGAAPNHPQKMSPQRPWASHWCVRPAGPVCAAAWAGKLRPLTAWQIGGLPLALITQPYIC